MLLMLSITILVVIYNITILQPAKERQRYLEENPPESFIDNSAEPALDGETYLNNFEGLFSQLPIQTNMYIIEQEDENIVIIVRENGMEGIAVDVALSYIETFGIEPSNERIVIRLI